MIMKIMLLTLLVAIFGFCFGVIFHSQALIIIGAGAWGIFLIIFYKISTYFVDGSECTINEA